MADSVTIANLRPEIWVKELHKDVKDNLFFENKQMMGKSSNSLIQVKDELKKEKGEKVTFGLSAKLSGAGIDGDSTLEGNEEAISSYDESVLIDQKRNAVRLTGRLDEQKAAYDMRMDAKEKLAIWKAETIERQIFMKLGGITSTDLTDVGGTTYSAAATWSNSAPIVPTADEAAGTGDRYICSDSAGLDSLADSDGFTTDLITKAKIKAKLASPKIRPLRIGGEEFYVLFIHPWQEADLKVSSTGNNWSQAQREAASRGEKNAIFTGALGVWDGVIIHSHEYVPTCQSTANFSTSGTAAGARAFRALLCGAQAAAFAEAMDPQGFVEETFDYKNKVGYSTGLIGGIQKTSFNSKDYGVISIDTGATNIG